MGEAIERDYGELGKKSRRISLQFADNTYVQCPLCERSLLGGWLKKRSSVDWANDWAPQVLFLFICLLFFIYF